MVKIANLEFVCFLNPQSQGLQEFVGTPDHLAPELVRQKENSAIAEWFRDPDLHYDQMVDIWAIGCLTYQLFTQETPFDRSFTDELLTEEQLYLNILNEEPQFSNQPVFMKNPNAIDFI